MSQAYSLGEAAAQRALLLDPGNSDALAALGIIRDDAGRTEEAREAFEQAIASNPNNAVAYRWLGRSYIDADPHRYYALARKAYAVDPLDPTIHFHLAVTSAALGRYGEALAAARELLTRGQEWLGYPVAINMHRFTGRLDRSVKTSFAAYRAVPNTGGYQPIVFTLIDLKELSLAETWLREVKRQTGEEDILTKAVLTFRLGRPEEAILLFVDALDRGEIPGQQLAYFIMRMTRDYVRAREVYEQGFAIMGQEVPRFDPSLWWPWYIDYALALQHTGEPERADELIREIKVFIDTQLANGVVLGPAGLHLQFLLAQVHAINDDVQTALTALREAMQDGFTCTGCLHNYPHFDSMHGEQAYAALIAYLEASNDAQRQRLVDDGMLLTPDEVLALEDFSFDPFAY